MEETLQPGNVAVAFNADSWASTALADFYMQARGILPAHKIAVSGLSSFEEIGMDEFRERILKPVLAALEERGLREKIDCLAYSSDFPFVISFTGDIAKGANSPHAGGSGSLTGLTYLYESVLARDTRVYAALDSNFYARRAYRDESDTTGKSYKIQPPRRFRSGTAWDRSGESTTAPEGRRYLLSTMLGSTSGRGLSLGEACDALARAAAADGTRPTGTIVYMTNDDVRSRTRRWGFDSAIRLLKEAGVEAVIETGSLPQGRSDIAGAMVGVADFNFAASGSRILPGAICEHLTSWGGILQWGAGQTPLTEFLRHGAAGASGTVVEPLAIQAKFPDPFIQVHYVRGASLAEAFYQSVAGPYQLLIVGDPLCRPWGPPAASAPAVPTAPMRFELPAELASIAADGLPEGQAVGRGFRAIAANGVRTISGAQGSQPWWQLAEIEPGGERTIEGYIEAPAKAFYQFQARGVGVSS